MKRQTIVQVAFGVAVLLTMTGCEDLFFGHASKNKLIDLRDHDVVSDGDVLEDDGDGIFPEGEEKSDLTEMEFDFDMLPDIDVPTDEDIAEADVSGETESDEDVPADAEVSFDADEVVEGETDADVLLDDGDMLLCEKNSDCNDDIVCTIDVCEFGQCRHIVDHSVCLGGKTCDPAVGCVASDDRLCKACDTSADCAVEGDLCGKVGLDTLCLVPCEYEGLCPAGFVCAPVTDNEGSTLGTACVPDSGVCCLDLDGDDAGIGVQCTAYDCDENDETIHEGALEICDNRDNNCDTQIDEPWPLRGTPCYDGIGQCQDSGTYICNPADPLGDLVCTAKAKDPQPEICDGLDNDCNGQTDNHPDGLWDDKGTLCETGVGQCRRTGAKVCDPDNPTGPTICSAPVVDPQPELCNGLDDDCDEVVDNNLTPNPCPKQEGVCAGSERVCMGELGWSLCGPTEYGPFFEPTEQTCDGMDNDCDGQADNIPVGIRPLCPNQYGVCLGAVKSCDSNTGNWLDCTAAEYGPLYEEGKETLCDGKDNNCDGAVDNIAYEDRPYCPKQAGVCAGSRTICENGAPKECTAAEYFDHNNQYQVTETKCDGLDNDCDGTTDNVVPSAAELCENQTGVCLGAVKRCVDGAFVPCTAEDYLLHDAAYQDGVESACDGKDNNCDGLNDNITEENRQPCAKQEGVCAGSKKTCVGGAWVECTDQTYLNHNNAYQVGDETLCDNLDNNCNGTVDDIAASLRPLCENQTGACAGAMRRCIAGQWQTACTAAEYLEANAAYESGEETKCDGIDNNCDGTTDNIAFEDRPLCTKQEGVCVGARQTCSGGQWVDCGDNDYLNHNAAYEGGAFEIKCDGLDNNCDGETDNLDAALRLPCENQNGVCAGSLRRCLNGVWLSCTADDYRAHSPVYEEAGETKCDGLDNDCDTLVDNILAGYREPCDLQQGVCAGSSKVCANGAWQPCTYTDYLNHSALYDEGDEVRCDNADNNCDGVVDNLVSSARVDCPVQTGVCAGAKRRCVSGVWQECDATTYLENNAAYEEGTETKCDNLDNNCDGFTDVIPAEFRPDCEKTLGVCLGAKQLCVDGQWKVCTANDYLNHHPAYDDVNELKCDSLDNNCDGTVDNVVDAYRLPCAKQYGVCAGSLRRCVNGAWAVCTNDDYLYHDPRYQTGDETLCDAADNNCDGQVDNIPFSLRLNCQNQQGVCAGAKQSCVNGQWQACTTTDYASYSMYYESPSETLCDSRDNDCNGQVDDIPLANRALCANQNGVCAGSRKRCESGAWLQCTTDDYAANSPFYSAFGETGAQCDALDNDCNGTVDDIPFSERQLCEKQQGVCAGARKRCVSGDWATCTAEDYAAGGAEGVYYQATESLCDNRDNDCDGQVDEMVNKQNDINNCGGCGIICYGSNHKVPLCVNGTCSLGGCEPGWYDLDGDPSDCEYACTVTNNGVEACDGKDNDCDGQVDEGLTRPLCDNQNGVCAGARKTCGGASGWLPCGSNEYAENSTYYQAGQESSCDGRDNDCDGVSDDNLTPFAPLCANQNGVCYGAKSSCGGASGWLPCGTAEYLANNSRYEATETKCDALDNDCDTQVDEPFASQLYTICYAGVGECLRAGVYVCNGTGAGVECSAVPGTPPENPEVSCDGLDNNCDGSTDEVYLRVGGVCSNTSGCNAEDPVCCKNDVCYEGVGVCRNAGIYVCAGAGVTCDATPGLPTETPQELTCDNLDNDCDGTADDPWTRVGGVCANTDGCEPGDVVCCKNDVCYAGYGLCQRAGFYVCDGMNGVACNAVPAAPEEEVCNYLDDNCDGTADEPFKNAEGKYAAHTACGNCSTDCTEIYNKPHAYGECDATGDPLCVMRCDPGYFDLNGVPDDGCEFLLDTTAIFVGKTSTNAADDAGCGFGPFGTGAGNYPCASITYGISRAQATGRTKVIVADAQYDETVNLVNGISLYGGYRFDNWERHLSSTMTIIRGTTAVGTHKKTVTAIGLTQATVLEGFVIYGPVNYAAGGNSYALYIRDTGSVLTVRNNLIYGGYGGPGAAGAKGADGDNGVPGNAGQNTIETDVYQLSQCQLLPQVPGNQGAPGDGGAKICGGVNVSGGSGAGAACPSNNNQQSSGSAGNNGGVGGGAAGAGGAGGYDRYTTNCGTFYSGGFSATASPGANGGDGSHAAAVSGCTSPAGSVSSGEWGGPSAANGNNGTHGGGGGGGGAGGGADVSYNCSGTDDALGGSGGGGGSGACGGSGGGGGGAGGGSFGIFITFTSPTSNYPVIQNNSVYGGSGGNGGNGGNGGVGGVGGNGGARGEVAGQWGFAMGQGGAGGKGGNGGHGGGGGGGCGGVSYGIFIHNNQTTPAYGANIITVGSGGTGGAGGLSLNAGSSGGNGSSGTAAATNY